MSSRKPLVETDIFTWELAGVKSAEGANAVLARLLPGHNRPFAQAAREATDVH